ncbi:peroxisomal biogenesis factor 11-domain-containing protein [Cunninghamella echinulata]|nr:peroxisomal biogenesis factor 11-domain-containing protein [Cunninghamella echinulata]
MSSTNITIIRSEHQLPTPMSSPPRSNSPTYDLIHTLPNNNSNTLFFEPIKKQQQELKEKAIKKQQPIIKKKKPSFLSLIEKYISNLEGRDKSIKIIQYAFKILLHYSLVNKKRWASMVSHFSQTRKILRLGHWVGTLQEMKQTKWNDILSWMILINTFSNEMGDDLFCLYKMGVVDPWIGKKAEKISIYCWFMGILNDLKSNFISLQKEQLKLKSKQHDNDDNMDHDLLLQQQQKVFLIQVSCMKLIMDGIFCACDIWQPSYSNGVQAWSGFTSGLLSAYKLWCKLSTS